MNPNSLLQSNDSLFPHFFSNSGSLASDFIVQDFAVIMIVAAVMLAHHLQVKTTNGNWLYCRRNGNWTLYSTI